MLGGTAFFFRNQDLGFEDGLWLDWPPVPGAVVSEHGGVENFPFYIFL